MSASGFKNLSLATVFLLIASFLTFTPAVANAAPDGPVDCSGGGTFTIANDVVISSADCIGSITIPAGVTVGSDAFATSSQLGRIAFLGDIPLGAPWGASSNVLVLRGISCGTSGYFVVWGTIVLGRHNCTGSVVIPEGITQIAEAAFDADPGYGGVGHPEYGLYNNSTISTSITSLTLPSTLTSIGSFGFRSGQFPALTLSNSVTSLGLAAFAGSALTSISIGDGLSTISPWVFSGLSSLTSVTFGTGVRTIDERAFSDAAALSEVTIPDTVELIGIAAFSWYHDSAPYQVRVPTLNYCGNADLTNTGLPSTPSNASTCLPAKPTNLSGSGAAGSGSIAFTPGADFGSPITSYKYSLNGGAYTAFSSPSTASPLTISGLVNGTAYSVSLKAVSARGEGAASRQVSFIAGAAAHADPAIAGVTAPVEGATPVSAVTPTSGYTGTVTWSGLPTTFKTATKYTATITLTPASGYTLLGVPANHFTIAGATSVTNATNSGVITAVFPATSGDGEIPCGTGGGYLITSYEITGTNGCVGAVVIPNAITAIAADAFRDITDVTSVTFAPDSSVTTIGDAAFALAPGVGPSLLTSITIPSSVTWIGNGAFQDSNLRSIYFQPGGSNLGIDMHAFKVATDLESIVIPSRVNFMGQGVFLDATALRSVTFAPGFQLNYIPQSAFDGASSLESIVIPSSVYVIFPRAFAFATSLASVTFAPGNALAILREDAFFNATSLSSIALPASLHTIYGAAFMNATSLTSVTFGAGSSLSSMGERVFEGTSSLEFIELPENDYEVNSYIFFGTGPSVFSRSHVSWKAPLLSVNGSPSVGEKVYASAFEKELNISGLGSTPEEYVYRVTRQENVSTTSIDLQADSSYIPLTKTEQDQWYEDMGFDPAAAPANNPYRFSWRAFMCVADNGNVTLTRPTSLSLSYASRDQIPVGSSSENHWALFRDATELLHEGESPSTRTVVGKIYDNNASQPANGPDMGLDPSFAPYSLGISQVYSSCGAGKTLEALEIVEPGTTHVVTTKEFEISPTLKLKRGADYFNEASAGITIGVTGGGGPPPRFVGAYNAALWGLTTIFNPAASNPVSSTYTGPLVSTFTPRILEANQSQTVRVFGQQLDQVTGVSHKGLALSFKIISAREIEIRIPALSVGIKEIKFDAGAGGIVTHLNAVEVIDTSYTQSPVTNPPVITSPTKKSSIWGFVAGLSRLDSNGTKNLKSITKRLATAKEITCIGFTMGPTATARDIQLSYDRASTICKRLAASIPGLKVIRIEGRQETKVGDRVRRVEIWWR